MKVEMQRLQQAIGSSSPRATVLPEPPIIQSVTAAKSVYCIRNSLGTMKLDDWLTRLVAVPPGRSPLANGLAIGMRIALFILIPLGIIAAIAIVLLHR